MTDQLPIRRAALLVALSLSMLLAACGGGGGGGAPTASVTSQPTSSPAPTSTSGTNGTLTTPQYAAGSQELAAFNQLNAMRQQCGFPALKENTLLDQAVANHFSYMVDNNYYGHYETQGSAGFTGATPQVRDQYAGYSGILGGEVIGAGQATTNGQDLIMGLASLPYHQALMFEPFTDIGVKFGALSISVNALVSDMGAASPPTYSSAPLTYPCQGTTNAVYQSAAAGESPVPIINGQTVQFPIGTPVAIVGNASDTIALSSGTMTDPGGSVINLDLLDSATDGNHEIASFAAVAFPASPLQPNTTYNVSLTGTDNGTPFSRNFSFTTGNTAY